MNNPSLHLNLRVSPTFDGDVTTVGVVQLWRMTMMVNREKRVVDVKLTRSKRAVKNEIPTFFKEPLRQRFGYGYEGSHADIDGELEEPHATFIANTLSVAVSRAAGAMFEDAYGVEVALHLEVEAGTGLNVRPLSVDTVLEMSLDDPFGFGRTAVYDTLDSLSDRGFPPDVNSLESDADGDTKWEPAQEGSEVHGDVRVGTGGAPEAYPGIDFLEPAQFPEEHSVHDAELAFGTAPNDKYEALAAAIQRGKRHGPVLVIGDHPGTLARALVSRGIDVVGVDPRNREEDHPGGQRFGRRRLINAELRVGDLPPLLTSIVWGAVVSDTTNDGEAADVSTARNLAFCRAFRELGCDRLYAQTRSAPLVDGIYDALRLPGHSRQGCELYVKLGIDKKLDPCCYSRVERKNNRTTFYLPVGGGVSRHIWDKFFVPVDRNKTTKTFQLEDNNWYHFVVSRFFLEAETHRKGWVDKTIYDARSPLELYANLVEYYGLDDNRRSDLRSLFEGQRATLVGGVARGLLERVPTMRHVMGQRYSALANLCVNPDFGTDGSVVDLFSDPRAGILLRGLSELRQVLDYDPMIARYHRVLPYESMSVLASRTMFVLLHHYVLAVRNVIGKPIHTWELQWLLWTLSVNGNRSEKVAYVLTKLGNVFFRAPTGRRAAKVSQARPVLDGFLGRLDDLRMRAAYVEFDQPFGAKVAKGSIAIVRRARETGGSERSYGSRVRGSMAPPPAPSVTGTARSVGHSRGGFSFSGLGGQF
ncbi:polyprotein [Fusarium graminearum alternavirus 1]|uniref:Polyprotein n=1 Tax=Fusarium graminearum alternavirus 1 TaxID=2060778 RepID=A0A2H5ACJ1_9VIRU|nr:polyprotein [Fusarium graminearum alternavirus 1]AUG69000.1 polyprotein [Fusarium graminearum alternavirus 1]